MVHVRGVLVLIVLAALAGTRAQAQRDRGRSSGDRRPESFIGIMRRMDGNHNGSLEAHEISDRARPYVERAARSAGLDPSRPLSIRAMEEAIRRSSGSRGWAQSPRSGESTRGVSPPDMTVPGFGHVDNLPPVLGFGEDAESLAYAKPEDLDRAGERLRQYDRNRDGFVDRAEARNGRWSDDPFQFDRNHDNRLSRAEIAERYARRRLAESGDVPRYLSSPSSSNTPRSRGAPSDDAERRRREEEDRRRRQSSASRETWYLAASIMERYDVNGNGALDPNEWSNMGTAASSGDVDGDRRMTRAELASWLARRAGQTSLHLPLGLPDWYTRRDADGDGQILMAEFAEEWSEDQADQFGRYDLNDDGIIVPEECLEATYLPSGAHSNKQLQVIPARTTVYSEIVVPDEKPVSDLDVQISITHTHDDYLDVYLIGPDGERVELFTGVGGSDDHFDNTIFDDEAYQPIVRGRPPFRGRYQPEAVPKRQTSLKHYYGKEIAGTWRLMIRAERSDRPGALNGWSLITKPVGEPTLQDEEEYDWEQRGPSPEDEPRPGPPEPRRGDWYRGRGGGPPFGGGPSGRPSGPPRGDWRRGRR